MNSMIVTGGKLDGETISTPDGTLGLHNPFMGPGDVPMMESYRLATHPGEQAEDGTYPDVGYSWEYEREWTMTGPNTYSSPLAHLEGEKARLPFRVRVARVIRALAERISPAEDDPGYDYGDDW